MSSEALIANFLAACTAYGVGRLPADILAVRASMYSAGQDPPWATLSTMKQTYDGSTPEQKLVQLPTILAEADSYYDRGYILRDEIAVWIVNLRAGLI